MAIAKVKKLKDSCYRILTINNAGKRKTRDFCGEDSKGIKRSVRERANGGKGKYVTVRET